MGTNSVWADHDEFAAGRFASRPSGYIALATRPNSASPDPKRGARLAKTSEAVQEAPGELQDTVVAEGWLRSFMEGGPSIQTAFVAGSLAFAERGSACEEETPGWRRRRPSRTWIGSTHAKRLTHAPSGYLHANERKEKAMPGKRANVKNEKQYEALKDKGMSKERAAKIANSPEASKHGGQKSGSGGNSKQGGTTAQKKAAGRKGGKATAAKRSR